MKSRREWSQHVSNKLLYGRRLGLNILRNDMDQPELNRRFAFYKKREGSRSSFEPVLVHFTFKSLICYTDQHNIQFKGNCLGFKAVLEFVEVVHIGIGINKPLRSNFEFVVTLLLFTLIFEIFTNLPHDYVRVEVREIVQ